ncbi:hypothetical protein GUJ93_ZPchr0010g8133 [Zizania palustris]|uniref:Uncharacterized protein n=1 Tax=Zizania palustris TaxID=103762 RepID=A0A8J6BLW1_ZIZPA|nr:hypothetical protein GUJ93_ZPchr0010g8133 [Zizania palustris]
MTTLQLSGSAGEVLILADLELFLPLLGETGVRLDLGSNSRIVTSLDNLLHVLDACLELGKALPHGVAEVELLLHCFPVKASLASSVYGAIMS